MKLSEFTEAGEDFPSSGELDFWGVHEAAITFPVMADSAVLREEVRPYDLGERTALFGQNVIRLAKTVPFNPVNNPILTQLVKAATSPGANYCEASDSISAKDFKHRISICRKEAKESRYWLRMLATSESKVTDEARVLWREATELNLIFSSIWRKA